ncbi:MAG TPA: hypothetical protein VGB74_09175 [Actinoplanes sp.]
MDGHRYADEEPSWYSGRPDPDSSGSHAVGNPYDSGAHAVGNPYDSGVHERPSGAFRLPQQRPVDPYALSGPAAPTTGGHARPADYDSGPIPDRGQEYPTVQPSIEPGSAREQAAGIYQTRRPVSSMILSGVTFLLMIPVVHLLIDVTLASDPTPRTVVPTVVLTLGMTLTGMGLFAIARGGPVNRDVWLRAPVAYLPAGLILLLAAGLAVA